MQTMDGMHLKMPLLQDPLLRPLGADNAVQSLVQHRLCPVLKDLL